MGRYSFRAASGLGYSAHVNEASLLVLTTYDSSGKAVCEHTSNCSVTPGCWRLVTVSYAYSRLRKSTVTCYLDGAATDARPYKLLATSAPFTRCFLGSSGTADEGAYLRGDLGAFYLFEREISAAAVQTLHGLGPGWVALPCRPPSLLSFFLCLHNPHTSHTLVSLCSPSRFSSRFSSHHTRTHSLTHPVNFLCARFPLCLGCTLHPTRYVQGLDIGPTID